MNKRLTTWFSPAFALAFALLSVSALADTGILVEYPNGTADAFCLRTESKLSGYGLLQKSKFSAEWSEKGAFGRMLCKVNGEGTEAKGSSCEFKGQFWGFFISSGSGWEFSPVGLESSGGCWDGSFSSLNSHYCSRQGDLIGLKFGDGSGKPAPSSFEDVCRQYLEIEKVTIAINSKKETVPENARISDLKPDSAFRMEIRLQNSGSEESVGLEDVEVTIEVEGLDIDSSESIGKLDAGDDDEVVFSEKIPDDAEDGTYDGHILVTGVDSFGQVHRAGRNFRIEVDREQHDLRIAEATVQADCQGVASIGFTIANYGRSSEREVHVNASGMNSSGMVFQLNTDSGRSGTIALPVGQETRQILLSVYDSKLKLNDEKSLPLRLPACLKAASQPKKQPKEEISVITLPKVEQEKTTMTKHEEANKLSRESRESRLMLAWLLAAYAAVMLLAIGTVLILKKKG